VDTEKLVGFWEIIEKGGPIMYPLLFISLAAVALAVERLIAFNQFGSLSPGLADEVIQFLKGGRVRDAIRRTEELPGPVAATLDTVLQNRDLPLEDIEREAEVTSEDYLVRLERFLPALDTFTTLSPLLGLLGTILGMVKVFQQFTSSQDEASKAKILAGVGESLYATAFGIAIAIFCFAVYNYFASRQRAITIETDQATTRVIGAILEQRLAAAQNAGIPHKENKRREKPVRAPLKKTKIEIIPMIDTMFFLLVFFILSSVGIIKLQGAPVNLPKTVNTDAQEPAQLTISIDSQKKIKVNVIDVKDIKDIGPVLEKEVKRQTGKTIKEIAKAQAVINADVSVPNGLVIQCIEQARNAGVSQFAIATVKKEAGAP
jgi:biopolymer transport protein ExbB/TolQ/biopolymer transport protein ExbD